MRTIVVMPTYQEADGIKSALDSVLASAVQADVLVVDDASPDGTGDLVERYAAARGDGRVSLLRRAGKQGLGSAYRAGFAVALDRDYDVVVQMDADGSHPASALTRLVERLAQGADLVLGSRYAPGGELAGDWPVTRRVLSRGGNAYARALLGSGIRDLTGGFKAWRSSCLRTLDLACMDAAGYAFQIQTTIAAVGVGASVAEVPIRFAQRELGSSKMSGRIVLEATSTVLRLRRERSGSGAVAAGPTEIATGTATRPSASAGTPDQALARTATPVPVQRSRHGLRVLLVTSEAPPIVSGISRCIERLSDGLLSRGHEVDVVSSVDMPRLVMGEYRLSSFLAHWPRIAERLDEYDVVNLHGPVPTLSDAFLYLAGRLQPQQRPALVYTHHSSIEIPRVRHLCRIYDAAHKRLSTAADLVIATSSHYAEEYRLTGERPVKVVPWGVDSRSDVARGDQPRRGPLRVLFVGQMRPYKGVRVLLRALTQVADATLTLIGDGPERADYEALAIRWGLADRVRFRGRVSDDQLSAAYPAHDVVVLPSLTRAEAFGLVVLEGMAAGCVPVVSDLPGVRDLAEGPGVVVPPGDEYAVAHALRQLSANRTGLQRRSAASLRKAATLSWDTCVDRYEQAFHDTVAGAPAGRPRVIDLRTRDEVDIGLPAARGA